MILAGRRVNDSIGKFIAQRTIKMMIHSGHTINASRVGILGLSFKEDVSDIRNSRIPYIVKELEEFGVSALVHDPIADPLAASREYGIRLASIEELQGVQALIVAVAHQQFKRLATSQFEELVEPGGIIVDVKSMIAPEQLSPSVTYWSL